MEIELKIPVCLVMPFNLSATPNHVEALKKQAKIVFNAEDARILARREGWSSDDSNKWSVVDAFITINAAGGHALEVAKKNIFFTMEGANG